MLQYILRLYYMFFLNVQIIVINPPGAFSSNELQETDQQWLQK